MLVFLFKDPNWYKARRYDGLEGMIPFNYVMEKTDAATSLRVTGNSSPGPPLSSRGDSMKRENSGVIEKRGIVRLHTMP